MPDLNVSLIIRAVDQATAPVRRFSRSLTASLGNGEQAAERFYKTMERATNLNFAAQAVGNFSRRLQNTLKGPVAAAVNFESAMADVRKVVNFDTPDGLQRLGQALRDMSKTIPITAPGLAQIAASGGQLGIKANNLTAFVDTVARMAVAFDMLPDEAGDAMAKLANVFQIPIDRMSRLGDAINHLSDGTAAKANEVVRALYRIGGTARQFGLAETQAAALSNAMISLGRAPEVAATAINGLLNRLQTASIQGRKFQSALASIGLSASDLEHSVRTDAQGALLDFFNRLEGLDKFARAKVLGQMFGQLYADDIALLVGSLDEYRKSLKLVASDTQFAGSMTKEFQNRSNTTANGFILLQNRMTEFKTTLGEALLPAIRELSDMFGEIVDRAAAWAKANPGLTKGLLTVTGIVAGLTAVLTPLLTTMAALVVIMGTFRRLPSALGGLLGMGRGGKGGGVASSVAGAAAPVPVWVMNFPGVPTMGLPGAATEGAAAAGAAASRGFLGRALSFLGGRVLPVAGAAYTGWQIGSVINKQLIEGTQLSDKIGQGVATILSPFSQTARESLSINRPQRLEGEIKVTIDAEGRPRVKSIQSKTPGVDLTADTGLMMATP